MDTLVFLYILLISATIFLFIAVLFSGVKLLGYSLNTYLLFLSAGVVSQLGGYFLLTLSLGNIPASVVTPTLLAQPVLTAILASLLLSEALQTFQVFGGLIVMVGVFIIHKSKKKV